MGFLHHTFSDFYARRDNWLTRVDVRIKMLYVVSLLFINIWAKNVTVPLCFFVASFLLLFSIKIPLMAIIRNMALPMMLAMLILLVKGLHEGERVWFSLSIPGYNLIFKEEGVRNGLHVCSKVLGGVSLLMLFSFTTTISRLCSGMTWFRLPHTVIEILAFMYRYIFLLLDEVSVMWTAQKSRLGHASWKKTIRSLGILGGLLIIRAFDRAERTHEAMYARGYEGGGILTMPLSPWRKKEYASFTGMVLIIPILIYVGNKCIW
ncbi:MAG: cobalt ECF transporter T component CbiQ [Candidatus Brocadia sp.]|nr:cobalt ECF transporter T component CbiQ [Candidatus Brocadia sp.]MCE7912698.1 cobalt ECF transporter T component CbiQ [Candidatus Brocadia sp. AMX3]MDG5997124.1 cobalt ECF transporter T component CbiQ [Candidatus Brocadia sp.]RIJ93050.1 MAG: cobalt ECF transporter T component CbiQ [Candidatus Brocadia sp.]